MRYEEVFNNLERTINTKFLTPLFKKSIRDLKNNFNIEVSTKFLRGLSNLPDTRKQTKRISYLMRKTKLKTKRVSNIIKVRGVNQYKTDVIIWGHDEKTKPFPEAEGLTDNEKRQIAEIKAIKEGCGIELFNHAEANLSDRQKQRDAFNLGGGAVVRDVKIINVGSYAVMHRQEILHIVY